MAKKVLITGAGSYIGTCFANWIKENCSDNICTDTVSLRTDGWREKDFGGFDCIFHVAGIAHADVGKTTEEEQQSYYRVNRDLTAECAAKAKHDGTRQFIYMSSMIVYGDSGRIGQPKMITKDTLPAPAGFYGDSKLQAEKKLKELESPDFKVVILRPPMIYGKDSKGNYPLLSKLAAKLPFFPEEDNSRSMLYVENLCKFVSVMILNEEKGTFYPQNAEYVRTSDMVRAIAEQKGKNIRLLRLFHPFLCLLGRMGGKPGGMVNKAFGNLTYDLCMSDYREEYRICSFAESIRRTEG